MIGAGWCACCFPAIWREFCKLGKASTIEFVVFPWRKVPLDKRLLLPAWIFDICPILKIRLGRISACRVLSETGIENEEWQSALANICRRTCGFVSRYGIHFLGGPTQTDLPPRVYDLVWGIQLRDAVGPLFAYDLAANFGIFADFEDSVRQGIQLPGHGIGFLRASPQFQIVFGVDYLDQDDGSLGSVELGISLKRKLSFRNNPVEMDLDQAFIIRWITQH